MTDIKATPATDEEIAGWLCSADGGCGDADCECCRMLARIAADAEKLRAKDEEIERLKGEVAAEEQRWHRALIDPTLKAELSTARAQVETLREALAERDVLIKAMGEPLLFLATGQPQDNVSNGLKEQFVSALRQYESWIRRDRYGAATEPKG